MKYLKKGFLGFCLTALLVATLATAAHAKTTRTDREKFLEFYKAIMWHVAAIEDLYRPFGYAASKENIFVAYRTALRIEGLIYRQSRAIKNMKVPKLSNASTEAELRAAKNSLADANFCVTDMLKKFIKGLDEIPTEHIAKGNLAEASKSLHKFKMLMIMAWTRFQDGASMLGIKRSELLKIEKQIKANYSRRNNHGRGLRK